jgi:hypothetical protein
MGQPAQGVPLPAGGEYITVGSEPGLRGKRLDPTGAPRHTPAYRLADCAGCWSAWVGLAGQNRGLLPRLCRLADRGIRALFESFGNCVLKMLIFPGQEDVTDRKACRPLSDWGGSSAVPGNSPPSDRRLVNRGIKPLRDRL